MDIALLREAIKAQKNRCNTVLLICSQEDALLYQELLHTLLEDMQEAQQDITLDNCVEANPAEVYPHKEG